jgi:predicted DsbA family dithiol-disulfide isomerase
VNSIVLPSRFTIEVVHDLICPWCYLGVRRLFRTLRHRPDLRYELIWRPFLLNPDMPTAGMSRSDYVLRKFGSEERGRRLYSSIGEIGRSEGIEFRFDRIRRAPNSVNAHRLVRYAARLGQAGPLVESLFEAHFTAGRDIGDLAVLLAMGTEHGLDPQPLRRFLMSGEEADAVQADNLRAHRLGINGVPCFVISGRHAIAGAQEPDVLARLLDVAAIEMMAEGLG